MARFGPEVITSNANFLTEDPDGLIFALISSSMFITWQKTVGGRLESRLRFNKLLTWNTFPVPDLSWDVKEKIVDAGKRVLAARGEQSGSALADMYPSSGLLPRLQEAHEALDREVNQVFGINRADVTELQRQDILFERYIEMINVSPTEAKESRK